ncbi:MAG: phytoene desaturase family protein [Verrucomicrobiae bacterium]|nr:phytoene desaturase family protein [Verrucomicrobiae bacterium]
MSIPHIVIIGAGPGGLAAAMLLTHRGCRVTVLERLPRVGGRTATLEIAGFKFDTGPTFFLYPQVLEEIFAQVGRRLRDVVHLTRLNPQYRLIFGSGGTLNCTPNVEQMEAEIARLSPADVPSFRRFLGDNRYKFQQFMPCLQNPFESWRDVATWRMARLLPVLKPWQSLADNLATYFRDPRLQLAFTFQAKYLGMSPFVCPSLFSILSFLEYDSGVWHPRGGCGAVTAAMARVATDLGAEISVGEPVEEIIFKGRRAIAVRTPRRTLPADALVINADFARAMERLVPDRLRRRWTNRRIARKKFSCSTFMMYLGIRGRYDHLAHHNIYISADYRQNLREIEELKVLPTDPSFYVQNAGVTDPTLAPPGHSTLYVLVPVPHQNPNVDWSREKLAFRARTLDQLAKIGLADLESRICVEHIVTPADWDQQFEIYRGATFNLAHNFRQMLHLRPHNRFEDLEGVYLVGGGTHPGSGLPVIFESARITCRLLEEDLGLPVSESADVLETVS